MSTTNNIYKDAKQLTDGIINIYLTLAKLEKEGKKESKQYKDLLFLLPKAKEIEKRKYLAVTPLKKDIYANFSALESARSGGGYFLRITKESLSAIRTLNFLDKSKYYTLDGIVFKNPKYLQLQEYLEEAFLYEISHYLKGVQGKEKGILIDFQYALFATSETIEEITIPKPNWTLSEEEMNAALVYLFPKVQELTNKLLDLQDEDITSEMILWVLYTKACIYLLPPLYEGIILQEMKNAIGLNRILGTISKKKNKKICDMLSYLNEERCLTGRKQA